MGSRPEACNRTVMGKTHVHICMFVKDHKRSCCCETCGWWMGHKPVDGPAES